MKKELYKAINSNEKEHWWFRARKNILIDTILNLNNHFISAISKESNKNNLALLDTGCGSGYFLSHISKYIKNSVGIDAYTYERQEYKNIIKEDITNITFENESFDIITMLDVLEHIEYEKDVLKEVHRVIKKNGTLIVTVPANQWMYSEHDKLNDHFRRYSKKNLNTVLKENGFEVERISYFNSLLFIPSVISRLIEKITKKPSISNDNFGKKSLSNNIFYKIFLSEKYLLRKMNFPFGVSLLAICHKK